MNDKGRREVRTDDTARAEDLSFRGGAGVGEELSPAPANEGVGDKSHRWAYTVALGIAGLLINFVALPLSPGIDLLFGGIPALLAAAVFGPLPGLLAAGIAALRTLWLWHHPYAWLIFTLEGGAVGYLVHRKGHRPMGADLLFWIVAGVPLLLLTYPLLLGVTGAAANVIFLKQPFNGLVNALAAEGLLLIPLVRRALRIQGPPRLRSTLAVVVSLAAVMPAMAFGLWVGLRDWDASLDRARERVALLADTHAAKLEQYVLLHERAVRSVALAAERRGSFDLEQLQRLVSVEHEQFPGFVNVYAANSRGVTVAFHPEVSRTGESLLGVDFSDRPYFRELRESRETVVSDVFRGRGGTDAQLVVIAHPIVLADTFAGYVLGALDLPSLPLSDPGPGPGERLRVIDSHGGLVFDSRSRAAALVAGGVRDSVANATIRSVEGAGIVVYRSSDAIAPAAATASQVLAGVTRIPALGWWVAVEQPVAEVQAFVAGSYARLLGLLILGTLLALLVSDWLAHYLAAPLLRLRSAAAAYGAGDLSRRVGTLAPGVPIEIRELGRDFDDMGAALAQRSEELEELGEIAGHLASTLDTDELLRRIIDVACRFVAADGCGIALLNESGRSLRTAEYSRGLLAPTAGRELPLDRSLNGWVIRTGQSALVTDPAHDTRLFLPEPEAAELGSIICAPLAGRSGPLGALTAVRSRAHPADFLPADLHLLERLARHAAIAVENAHLVNAAQAASRAKSDFIATMSHELRTPLNAVLGHLQLLQMGIHGELTDAQRESLERIGAASNHLRGLIEEVLSFARLEAGRTEVHISPTELCGVVEEVGAVIEPLAREKGLELHVRCGATPEVVPTDKDRVRQILINLTGNAVKFTERGRVELSLEMRSDEAVLAVADTGPGIPAQEQQRLFRAFEQLESGFSRPHEGTGLGLYLSGQFAELVGGRIEVESEVGRGSTFSLILPRQGPEIPEDAVVDEELGTAIPIPSS